jgi:hypothetical protein
MFNAEGQLVDQPAAPPADVFDEDEEIEQQEAPSRQFTTFNEETGVVEPITITTEDARVTELRRQHARARRTAIEDGTTDGQLWELDRRQERDLADLQAAIAGQQEQPPVVPLPGEDARVTALRRQHARDLQAERDEARNEGRNDEELRLDLLREAQRDELADLLREIAKEQGQPPVQQAPLIPLLPPIVSPPQVQPPAELPTLLHPPVQPPIIGNGPVPTMRRQHREAEQAMRQRHERDAAQLANRHKLANNEMDDRLMAGEKVRIVDLRNIMDFQRAEAYDLWLRQKDELERLLDKQKRELRQAQQQLEAEAQRGPEMPPPSPIRVAGDEFGEDEEEVPQNQHGKSYEIQRLLG